MLHGLAHEGAVGALALMLRPLAVRCACLQGRPIYVQHLGQINAKALYELTTEDRMLKFHVQVMNE